jgi:hypothetical protein
MEAACLQNIRELLPDYTASHLRRLFVIVAVVRITSGYSTLKIEA